MTKTVSSSHFKMSLIDSGHSSHPLFYDTDQNTFQYVANDDKEDGAAPTESNLVIDSFAYPEVAGLTSISGLPITLYMQHDDDYPKLSKAILLECGHETPFTSFQENVEISEGHWNLPRLLKTLTKQ